ncbi:hypothetical protein EW145_g8609 [Phellinidium pouzarii]|uniref:Uncharacterized protein n=1 Tax=Phellinidium pouzarii TaxID=167371 RepID=A0A4V3X950_9AGAM|nr:hypothetical protein EW145_g8609 [Phellinidium pouzarii]
MSPWVRHVLGMTPSFESSSDDNAISSQRTQPVQWTQPVQRTQSAMPNHPVQTTQRNGPPKSSQPRTPLQPTQRNGLTSPLPVMVQKRPYEEDEDEEDAEDDEDDEDDEEQLTKMGRCKPISKGLFNDLGKHLGRAYATWDNPQFIISVAVDRANNNWEPPAIDKFGGK